VDRSYGWRGSDGKVFGAPTKGAGPFASNSLRGRDLGTVFGSGDTVGCGVDMVHHNVIFTKNGTIVAEAFEGVPCPNGTEEPTEDSGDLLHGVVALHGRSDRIRCNFSGPFHFDAASFAAGARKRFESAAAEHEVPDQLLGSLVEEYLCHQGFKDTLEALQDGDGRAAARHRSSWAHASSLDLRSRCRACITTGNATDARVLVHQSCPDLLRDKSCEVPLLIQIFIEHVKLNQHVEAVRFARNHLEPLLAAGAITTNRRDTCTACDAPQSLVFRKRKRRTGEGNGHCHDTNSSVSHPGPLLYSARIACEFGSSPMNSFGREEAEWREKVHSGNTDALILEAVSLLGVGEGAGAGYLRYLTSTTHAQAVADLVNTKILQSLSQEGTGDTSGSEIEHRIVELLAADQVYADFLNHSIAA